MAAAVGWTLLQAAVRAPPAGLAGAHPGGPALPVAAAAPRAQGEAEGGIEAQQVVVGVAEEMQQHLGAQDGHSGTPGTRGLDWEGGLLPSPPHPGRPHPLSWSLSTLLWPSLSCCLSAPAPLLSHLCIDSPLLQTPPRPPARAPQSGPPTARPHQPCLRRPQWGEAECSHSDWQAGALGESPRHTRTGSRKCIPCPGKGSPAGSGAEGLGLGSESRGAGLRCGPSPRASMYPTQKYQGLPR